MLIYYYLINFVNSLSANQLLGCGVVKMKLVNGKVVRGEDKENEQTVEPEKKKKRKSKVKHANIWKHADLPTVDDFKWTIPKPHLSSKDSPTSLFEAFFY